MTDLSPYGRRSDSSETPPPVEATPAAGPAGVGPRGLWRQANAWTKTGLIAILVVAVAVGAFTLGRGGDDPSPAAEAAAASRAAADAAEARATEKVVGALIADPEAKTQDSSAKSDARNMVTQVESCAVDAADYSACRTAEQLSGAGELPVASSSTPSAGEVAVTDATATTYRVVSVSRSGNRFAITKDTASGGFVRSCSARGSEDGGCQGGTW